MSVADLFLYFFLYVAQADLMLPVLRCVCARTPSVTNNMCSSNWKDWSECISVFWLAKMYSVCCFLCLFVLFFSPRHHANVLQHEMTFLILHSLPPSVSPCFPPAAVCLFPNVTVVLLWSRLRPCPAVRGHFHKWGFFFFPPSCFPCGFALNPHKNWLKLTNFCYLYLYRKLFCLNDIYVYLQVL